MKETLFSGVSFPVFFSDGVCESNIGDVVVYPSLDLNQFQSILSQKIGIPPHQFYVYLSSPDTRRKIPVTGKVNFGAISRDKSCFFLVVLKRSRRDRRQKDGNNKKKNHHGSPEKDLLVHSTMEAHKGINKNPGQNVMILRRGMGFDDDNHQASSSAFEDWVEYEKRVRKLQIEKGRYLMSIDSGLTGLLLSNNGERERGVDSGNMAVCEECLRAEIMGTDFGFHCCVYDAVTFGFRSSAGPIARPVTNPIKSLEL